MLWVPVDGVAQSASPPPQPPADWGPISINMEEIEYPHENPDVLVGATSTVQMRPKKHECEDPECKYGWFCYAGSLANLVGPEFKTFAKYTMDPKISAMKEHVGLAGHSIGLPQDDRLRGEDSENMRVLLRTAREGG